MQDLDYLELAWTAAVLSELVGYWLHGEGNISIKTRYNNHSFSFIYAYKSTDDSLKLFTFFLTLIFVEIVNKVLLLLSHFSHVQLFVTLRTVNLPGSSVHGISQARILEWVAIASSRQVN